MFGNRAMINLGNKEVKPMMMAGQLERLMVPSQHILNIQ